MNGFSSKRISTILFYLCAFTLVIFTLRTVVTDNDFNVYLHAGIRFYAMENIYAEPHYHGLPYFYSPMFALFMGLCKAVPVAVVKTGWYFLNVLFIVRMVMLLQKLAPSVFTKYTPILSLVFCFLVFRQVQLNMLTGQVSFLILWCMVESFYQIKTGNLWLAGVVLAIGMNIKIIPIIMLPWLVYSRNYKAIKIVFILSFVLVFFPYLFTGSEYGNLVTLEWLKTINPFSRQHSVEDTSGHVDIGAFFFRYLSASPHHGNSVYLDMPLAFISRITSVARLLAIIMVLLVLKLKWKQQGLLPNVDRDFYIICGLWGTVPLLFPHQREYSFLFMLPALFILIRNLKIAKQEPDRMPVSRYIFLALGILMWGPFINGEFYNKFWDQWNDDKWITLGGTVLMVLYFTIGKRKNAKIKQQFYPSVV